MKRALLSMLLLTCFVLAFASCKDSHSAIDQERVVPSTEQVDVIGLSVANILMDVDLCNHDTSRPDMEHQCSTSWYRLKSEVLPLRKNGHKQVWHQANNYPKDALSNLTNHSRRNTKFMPKPRLYSQLGYSMRSTWSYHA